MKPTLIYVRISQDRTGEALGVSRQLEDCRRLAEQRGWSVVSEIQDNDLSAAGKTKRPGFDAVLDAIKSGDVEAVIAWSLDRLTRNRRDTVRLIEAGQEAKCTIALVRGSDLDLSTASGRMVADLLASVSRNEIEVKSERQRRAVEQAAAAGRRAGGRRPFGYTLAMEPQEPEASAVRDAYRMLLEGRSLRAIATDWNSRGLGTPQGNQWTGQVVSRTLRKHTYAGMRAHRGTVVAEAVWEALVSQDVWHAAQAVLRDPSRRSPGGTKALLTGVALCRCGATVHAGGGSGTQPYRIYRCSGSTGHVSRRAEPVDQYVETVMKLRLAEPDIISSLLAPSTGPDLEALALEADAKRRRLDVLAEEFAEGELTASQLRTATTKLRLSITELEGQLAAAHGTTAIAPFLTGDVEAKWDAAEVGVRRQVISQLAEVTILPTGRGVRRFDPESVVIQWRRVTA